MFGIADAGSTTLGNRIGQPVVHDQFDAYCRVRGKKAIDQRRQYVDHDRTGHVQFQQSGHRRRRGADLLQGGARLGQQGAQTGFQFAPCFGWRDAARVSGQEGQAKLLFQTRDGVADIRRRQSQPFSGGAESLRIAHRNKYGKIVQGWLAIVLHGDQSILKPPSYQTGGPLLH